MKDIKITDIDFNLGFFQDAEGWYVDTTKEMLEFLKDKSVYSLGSGANFGTGDMNPIEDFIEASKEDSDFPEELRFLASYFKESKNRMKF